MKKEKNLEHYANKQEAQEKEVEEIWDIKNETEVWKYTKKRKKKKIVGKQYNRYGKIKKSLPETTWGYWRKKITEY